MADQLEVFPRMSGPYHLTTYFLTCRSTRQTIVVDPGGRPEDLTAFMRGEQLVPLALIMTHGHADPAFSADQFKQDWDVPYCIHGADDDFFQDPRVRAATRKSVGLPPPYPADLLLAHGQHLTFGRLTLEVIHTPGHTPGSCCFLCENRLFSGDTLFVGEAGRTDLPGGDLEVMIRSIRERILPLSPETKMYPAHHHGDSPLFSTLARERKENIYITDFILDP